MTNREIAQAWAAQSAKCGGRNTDAFTFRGNKIYSYRTCVGCIAYSYDGTPVFLLNTGFITNTTVKHMAEVEDSIQKGAAVMSVSCGKFIVGWKGCGTIPTRNMAIDFVVRHLNKVCESILEFKDSRKLSTETSFTLHWYGEAVRFTLLFPYVHIADVALMDDNELESRYAVSNPKELKAVLKCLLLGKRDLATLIDAALGDGAYADYYNRTASVRKAAATRASHREAPSGRPIVFAHPAVHTLDGGCTRVLQKAME